MWTLRKKYTTSKESQVKVTIIFFASVMIVRKVGGGMVGG